MLALQNCDCSEQNIFLPTILARNRLPTFENKLIMFNKITVVLNDSTDFMQPTCGLVFNSTENAGLELTQR